MSIIFAIIILIVSVILHEVAHGYMANWLGDPTARLSGRLTLNPLPHIDPVGSILLPVLMLLQQPLTGVPLIIGYAKPVPYNPYNLQGYWAEALVAFAGPGTNIALAVIFGIAIRFLGLTSVLVAPFAIIVELNLLLALFNLIPFPPLDGSKVLSALLPGALGAAYDRLRHSLERLGILTGTLILMLVFYFLLMPIFSIVIGWVFTILTGITL
ncbi:MAG: site-2 protease family protein [Minisyncoccia bacterium]